MERAELTFDKLNVGQVYADRLFNVTPDLIKAYCLAIGTNNPVYEKGESAQALFHGPIAPPTLPVMWTPPRVCVQDWIIPAGGIHIAQEWESLDTVRPGDILHEKIYVKKTFVRNSRRYVVFEAIFQRMSQEVVAKGRMTVLWPK